jgi:hypothetical protein
LLTSRGGSWRDPRGSAQRVGSGLPRHRFDTGSPTRGPAPSDGGLGARWRALCALTPPGIVPGRRAAESAPGRKTARSRQLGAAYLPARLCASRGGSGLPARTAPPTLRTRVALRSPALARSGFREATDFRDTP